MIAGSKKTLVRSAGLAVLLTAALAHSGQGQASGWMDSLSSARMFINRSDHRIAERQYTLVLGLPGVTDGGRATAHFGRAFARQQRLLHGDTLSAPTNIQAILADYDSARALDARTYSEAIDNNVGILLRATGKAGDAIEFFRSANAKAGNNRGQFLANTGATFETLEQPDSAAWYYRRALEQDSTRSDALVALLQLQLRRETASTAIGTSERWSRVSTLAATVASFLFDLMLSGREFSAGDAQRALDIFVTTLPVAKVGFASFEINFSGRLREVSKQRAELQEGISALINAYGPHTDTYAEPGSARWWHASGARQHQRGAAWSSLLRWVGDLHNQRNDVDVARGFYEAALGERRGDLSRPEIDRGALLPLALIYAQQSNRQAERDLIGLTQSLFAAKGAAYEAKDLEQIRQLHLTLASLYAAQGVWDGAGPYNAEFQTEMLREATRRVEAATSRKVYVPPDLLEKLAVHYQATNRADKAAQLKLQVRDDYIRKNKRSDADSVVRRIETGNKDLLRPISDAGRDTRIQLSVPENEGRGRGGGGSAKPGLPQRTIDGTIAGPNGPIRGVAATLEVDGRSKSLTLDSKGVFKDSIPADAKSIKIRVSARGFEPTEVTITPGERVSIRLRAVRKPDGERRRIDL